MNTRAQPASPSLGWPLAGLGALVLLTLVAVGTARLAGSASSSTAATETTDAFGAVLVARRLHFRDRADGGIDVLDADSGASIGVVEPGSQGFVRGALRGLAQERKRRGLGAEAPFELSARAGGALVLADPATGRRVELASFGPVNAGAFARWLPLKEARP
jgi:putative photosynthetic complex assembly protein